MKVIKKILNAITPTKVKTFFAKEAVKTFRKKQEFSTLSYSQEGEDLILNRFLENKGKGFYVDVGAHHPKKFSNTYKFYKKGWQGINIDAMPNSMIMFNRVRPKDINLEIGISKEAGELLYYMFNEPALNTFSKVEANKKNGLRSYKIIKEKVINTVPLRDILSKNIEVNQTIDFMTIDVEGLELQVLESNDWNTYRPKLVLVEDLNRQPLSSLFIESDLYLYLNNLNYELVAKTLNTLFFKDKENK